MRRSTFPCLCRYQGDIEHQKSSMDINIVFGSASVLFGAYGAAKIYYDLSAGRVTRMRDQYRFAKEYFLDRNSGDVNHPFLWEKGLKAIVGDESLDAEDIEYLLKLKNPVRAVSLYSLGKDYLQLRKSDGGDAVEFRRHYRSGWSRGWRKWTYSALYGLFVVVAL